MRPYHFDTFADRSGSESLKWSYYGEDVIPLWIAEMDFDVPEEIQQAVQERASHPIYGYTDDYKAILSVLSERLERLYQWQVDPDEMLVAAGTLSAIGSAYTALTDQGDQILGHAPTYPPFLSVPQALEREMKSMPLSERREGQTLHYDLDMSCADEAVSDRSKIFLFCNPHNPTGKVFRRDEVEQVAAFCEKHNLIILSDEIHAELLLDKVEHVPVATLSPEIADRTLTVLSTSKVFNLPGLGFSVIISKNKEMLKKIRKVLDCGFGKLSSFSTVSALAAYRHADRWLSEVNEYLRGNRDYVSSYLQREMPELAHTVPAATFLMWIDCNQLETQPKTAHTFFLEEAKVALAAGEHFGAAGKGYARLTFASPRSLLEQAMEQMAKSIRGKSMRN